MPKKPKDYIGSVERLKAALQTGAALPPAPRRTHTKRHAVEQLRELLVSQIATRGCTIQGLADYLGQHGLKIHPITLRLYLGDVRPYRQAYRQQAARTTGERDAPAFANARESAKTPGSSTARSPTHPAPLAPSETHPAVFRQASESAARSPHPATDQSAPVPVPQTPAAPRHPVIPLSGRFTPRPELPYDELIRQAEERKRRLVESAPPGKDAAGQRAG